MSDPHAGAFFRCLLAGVQICLCFCLPVAAQFVSGQNHDGSQDERTPKRLHGRDGLTQHNSRQRYRYNGFTGITPKEIAEMMMKRIPLNLCVSNLCCILPSFMTFSFVL